jgi:hypothetical protein
MKNNFNDYLNRKKIQYGGKFDPSDLGEQFIKYFESGERIEVNFVDSKGIPYEAKRGTIGITTGWKPIFLLMLTKRSISSSYTLRKQDFVTKVIR